MTVDGALAALHDWLADLCRDVMWARAHVCLEAGWKMTPAWAYLAACPHPHDGLDLSRVDTSDHEVLEPRTADMDGDIHTEGGGCCPANRCGCGNRLHTQPVYAGIWYLCERCDADGLYWRDPE